ncbi:symmetrical bis(5'-nucleosyl)-tetraphosphatase [Polynucleobacter sp. MG-5-Ahmo-C2]|jgi:bis(5'-nucleosyl)-tetraphosphatase (symmetrical)|uniref:symmetrical bis(5'-nucleosyl)-tetraphosphatase n=1 Tax=Polynucleobacter sp. MG-5-Ahmo-C2 TaxID=2081051 RepID=UPI001BFE4644|nr:symmetrical bis(5'-nucleosyl)-tetraphosphatase [Polynucleobacter sp. MG-5-Ahmo-C2]QWD98742.1 symmetrical bis(5'-nucleosyl)-tetraphosphatase [Polynucleobacter sp. MG-5-Ahmo-C2]
MSKIYAVGDIQGCAPSLKALVKKLPKKSNMIFLGDLVNRGPNSLAALRQLKSLQESGRAECILGNHDLHLLAIDAGVRKTKGLDTVDPILKAPDRKELIDWVRNRPMALSNGKVLTVHAGVLPQWDLQQTLECAQEVERALRGKSYKQFLANMYGNTPNKWSNSLKGYERLRVITNALTRMRFCTPSGQMEFESKEGLGNGPKGYIPWFKAPKRKTANTLIYFGHWSTLGLLRRNNVIGLDTGCVWGGKLTALEIANSNKDSKSLEIIQVDGYDHPLKM